MTNALYTICLQKIYQKPYDEIISIYFENSVIMYKFELLIVCEN